MAENTKGNNCVWKDLLEQAGSHFEDQNTIDGKLNDIKTIFLNCYEEWSNIGSNPRICNKAPTFLPYGGYAMEAVQVGGDFDLVMIVPRTFTMTDFFTTFSNTLQGRKEIEHLQKVEHAYMPILKMAVLGIQVDLGVSIWMEEEVPENVEELVHVNEHLHSMSICSIRAVHGVRAARRIRERVPNWSEFVAALKLLKLWAKAKGIYDQQFGFLGGITVAVILSRICASNAEASAAQLVRLFFETCLTWPWPKPYLLEPVQSNPRKIERWDMSTSNRHRAALMVVVVPALPEKNALPNISATTMSRIQSMCSEALEAVDDNEPIKLLDHDQDFFKLYQNYLKVTVSSDLEAHFSDWSSLVAAKFHNLVHNIEKNRFVEMAHPYRDLHTRKKELLLWIGLRVSTPVGQKLDLKGALKEFKLKVHRAASHARFLYSDTKLLISHVSSRDALASLEETGPVSN